MDNRTESIWPNHSFKGQVLLEKGVDHESPIHEKKPKNPVPVIPSVAEGSTMNRLEIDPSATLGMTT